VFIQKTSIVARGPKGGGSKRGDRINSSYTAGYERHKNVSISLTKVVGGEERLTTFTSLLKRGAKSKGM